MSAKNIVKPTLASLADGLQFGFGVFREHANYWLVKYTDRKEILLSNNLKENPELVIFLYLNKERIIRDLYEELKQ